MLTSSTKVLFGVLALCAPLRATTTLESAPGGWLPLDEDGTRRYAALKLFSTLDRVQANVTKYAGNPLFGQDKPWETRIDNGYPNVVFDAESSTDGPWRLWYGNIGPGGQYLLYANSSDGISWQKPNLGRYDLSEKWAKLLPQSSKRATILSCLEGDSEFSSTSTRRILRKNTKYLVGRQRMLL